MSLDGTRDNMLRKHIKTEQVDNELAKAQEDRKAIFRKARKLVKNAIAKVKKTS